MTRIDLKELEKKAFTSYHQDGILDICIGLFILSFGIGMLCDMYWLYLLFYPSAFSVWLLGKKYVTVPRIGYVTFGPERSSQLRRLVGIGVVVLCVMVLASFGLMVLATTNSIPPWVDMLINEYYALVVGIIGTALFAVTAYFLDITRLYLYAVGTLIVFVGSYVVSAGVQYGALVVGVLVVVGGVIVLVQFMRLYPVPEEVT